MSGDRKSFNFPKEKHCRLGSLTVMTCEILEWITNLIICTWRLKKKKKRLVGISAVAQWLKNPTAVAQITVEA